MQHWGNRVTDSRFAIVSQMPPPEPALRLLKGYGFDPAVLTPRQFLEMSDPVDHVLTWDRACVPLLATLEPAWAPDCLGALASFGTDQDMTRHLTVSGLSTARTADLHVLAGVRNGAIRIYWMQPNAVSAALVAQHLNAVCAQLSIRSGVLHVAMTQADLGLVAMSPFCADPALMAAARAEGVCPIWISVCHAQGRTPFVPQRPPATQSQSVGFA